MAVLIHDAQDLARSPSGWIKTSALIAYNGPSIPGNFDTHSGEIVNTSTFLLKVHGLSQPLTDEYIKGLVSKDNLRGPKRFILGLYAPGKRTNSTQLVIRLTPIPAADPNAVFFFCIAERAIKPCRSSRSKLRGEFGIPRHLQNRNQKHNKATNKQNTKQTKDKNRQVLECETRGEKRVKRPKRPNALICRTPGGSMRYP